MKPAEVSTPSDEEVLIKRSFDAPASLVWRAYTEPELMRRWLTAMPGWSMPVCEMTTDVGGKYRWRWRDDELLAAYANKYGAVARVRFSEEGCVG